MGASYEAANKESFCSLKPSETPVSHDDTLDYVSTDIALIGGRVIRLMVLQTVVSI